jgi:hypothetical protein
MAEIHTSVFFFLTRVSLWINQSKTRLTGNVYFYGYFLNTFFNEKS